MHYLSPTNTFQFPLWSVALSPKLEWFYLRYKTKIKSLNHFLKTHWHCSFDQT